MEYDKEPFFEEFLAFKEDRLGNREIPMFGSIGREHTDTSNFVSKDIFCGAFARPRILRRHKVDAPPARDSW